MQQNVKSSPTVETSDKTRFLFRAEDHSYWMDGRRIPGFSEIRTSLGIGTENAKYYTEDGRAQGQALHAWLLFLAQGKVSNIVPEPEICGRIEGIKKFLSDTKFSLWDGEKPLYDSNLGCACTPDLCGFIGNKSVLIEAKRGSEEKWHQLQTACQSLALASWKQFNVKERYALYLKDGDYRLVLHDDDEDFECWTALVNGYHAKEQYKK